MIVYIAAPYQTLVMMHYLRRTLISAGFDVNASWLNEDPENISLQPEYAVRDMQDISEADVVVVYNPPEWTNKGAGGRHVELGIALALKKPVIVFGGVSNIFHLAPGVELAVDTFDVLTRLEHHQRMQADFA